MLIFRELTKVFDNGFHALGPFSYEAQGQGVLGVIGPSGCGKSTLLRLVAGLEHPSAGSVSLDGEMISGARPDVGVVFQEPRLLPWKSVASNVGFGLWDRPAVNRAAAVAHALERVGLGAYADALPRQLSGGMAQRAGIARALVLRPRLLLLDEPFSALDPITRVSMQDHLLHILEQEVPNALLITHDMDEALVLCDQILVLEGPPARIRRVVSVDLPRPRVRTSESFQHYKSILMREVLPRETASNASSYGGHTP